MSAQFRFTTATGAGLDFDFLTASMAGGLFALDSFGAETALFSLYSATPVPLAGNPQVTAITHFTLTKHLVEVSFQAAGATLGSASFEGLDLSFTAAELPGLPEIIAQVYQARAALDFTGNTGADRAHGTLAGDLIKGLRGDDVLIGGGGNDRLNGGGGRDFLAGDDGNDRLIGGTGHDMLRGGDGSDRLGGGRGNDVIEAGSGRDTTTGGGGADMFVFDMGSAGRTVVRDFSPRDLILFTGVATTASGTPEGYSASDTLADLKPADLPLFSGVSTTASGTPEGYSFHQNANGYLTITMVNLTVVLRNTTAGDVGLDQVYFSEASSDNALTAFDVAGSTVIGQSIDGSALVVTHAGDGTQLGYGGAGIMFETYMGDVQSHIGAGALLL